MARERKNGRGIVWAGVGALVLLAGVIAIVVGSLSTRTAPPPVPPSSAPSTEPSSPASTAPGAVVDPSVSEKGWTPEPITTDAGLYMARALEAAATFDTQKGDRDEWLRYLDSWFTPDTRYTTPEDRDAALESSKLELRQSVVFPEDDWGSLAQEKGRVTAIVTRTVDTVSVPEDASGDMLIGTADVALTFTRVDGDGAEHSYEEQVRVSVQVLCGLASVPTPGSDQRPGDCKVVRFFPEPMEP